MKLMVLLLAASLLSLPGCATRTVTESVVAYYDLDIKLRGQKEWLGGYEPLGYSQPVEITSERLASILGGIEVDVRKKKTSSVRERRSALSAKMLLNITEVLPKAFAEASGNQQVIVMAQRKQMQKGVFNRKFLTSFTTYVKGDDLYVIFSRIEWPIDETKKTTVIPQPWPGEVVMPFETVGTDIYELVGTQGVRVKWKNTNFGPPVSPSQPKPSALKTQDSLVTPAVEGIPAAAAIPTPPSTQPQRGAPLSEGPKASMATKPAAGGIAGAAAGGAAAEANSSQTKSTSDPLKGISSDDLRDLANLEDAYSAGRMDEAQYQRERARILNRGN